MACDINVSLRDGNAERLCFPMFSPRCGKKATLLLGGAAVPGGNHVYDTVAPPFELTQEGWQHVRCLHFGIVK